MDLPKVDQKRGVGSHQAKTILMASDKRASFSLLGSSFSIFFVKTKAFPPTIECFASGHHLTSIHVNVSNIAILLF